MGFINFRRILRLDATLMLLEAKLKSVDGVSELEEHPGFDIVRSLDQAMPRNSLNSVNSPVISGSSDPSRLEYSYFLISFSQLTMFAVCASFSIYNLFLGCRLKSI